MITEFSKSGVVDSPIVAVLSTRQLMVLLVIIEALSVSNIFGHKDFSSFSLKLPSFLWIAAEVFLLHPLIQR